MIRLLAHRGSRHLAPENTSAAFDIALSHGADVLETDVRLSRDGAIMVIHDARLDRTTDGSGAIRDFDRRQLDRFDTGYRFRDDRGRFPWRGRGLRLLALDELLDAYPGVALNIDIKDPDHDAAEALACMLGPLAGTTRFCVGSFHADVISHFRRLAPDIPTAAHRGEVARLWSSRFVGILADPAPAFRAIQIPPRYRGLPLDGRAFIAQARRFDIEVHYWTINEPEAMRRLLRRGATGIVTDRPDLARHVIDELRSRETGSGA